MRKANRRQPASSRLVSNSTVRMPKDSFLSATTSPATDTVHFASYRGCSPYPLGHHRRGWGMRASNGRCWNPEASHWSRHSMAPIVSPFRHRESRASASNVPSISRFSTTISPRNQACPSASFCVAICKARTATLRCNSRYATSMMPQVAMRGDQSQPKTYCGLRKKALRLSLRSVRPLPRSVHTARSICARSPSLTYSRPTVSRTTIRLTPDLRWRLTSRRKG